MRTLKLVVFSVIFFLSSNLAHSLGVGDITVNSALNQPLNAEIQLVALRPGEIDNIRVSMATPAEFARAGIDRPYVLASLKFRVEERPGNKAAIIVYSKKAIKEPFLDFLVEIDWRSGRMLREYTMLLDPPVFAQRKAERVQVPVAPAPAPEPAPQPAPAPVINQPAPQVTAAPVERPAPVAVSPSATDDDLFPRVDIGAVGQPVGKKEAPFRPALDVSSEGYKTKTNDTLWSISDRLRPEGISIEQMMLALQNANPEAFEANNINGLKAGYVLRIPDQDALLSFSKSEAFREAQNQHKAWSTARGGLIERATTKGTAPVSESSTAAAPTTPSEAGIKLVTPESGVASKGAGTGKDLEALRQELALVNEQLASKEQQNTELEGRLRELEEQITSMERLIELKNKSLEDLQSKVTEPVPAPAAPLTPEPVQPETAEPVAVDEPAQPAPAQPAVPVEPADGEEVINRYALKDIPQAEAPPAPVAKPAAKKPAPVVAPAGEESIVDTILGLVDDVVVLAMVGGVLILVLALVWVIVHRRRMSNMAFPESILTDKGATTTITDTDKSVEETSLLSDFAPTSVGTSNIESDAGEVDPLSEADVYLAYNKYQQAEELLLNAISGEPDRIDLKVKLLEVHFNAKNSDNFAMLAEDVHSAVGDTDAAIWDKVKGMGSQLCPDNPLFAEPEETGLNIAEIEEGDTSAVETTDDLEFDLGDLEIDEEPEEEPVAELETIEEAPLEMQAEELAAETDELSLEDLGDLSLDMDEEPVAEEVADDMASLELDMDTTEADLDLSLVEDEAVTTDEVSESDSGLDLGDLDIESLDEITAEEPAEETAEVVAETVAEGDDSFGIDEVATKLDLAKAYIDMGDPDGARSILDEVLSEGNDAQKSEAQELIQQL